MNLARSRLGGEVIRLALAAVLLLSAVAGARMQGEMAALALAFGPHGAALCSGASMPPVEADEGAPSTADHCQTCVMPVLGASAPPYGAVDDRAPVRVAFVRANLSVHIVSSVHFAARGPPQAV